MRRRPDPLARQAVLAIAAGRIAIGVGATLATRPALGALGFPPEDPTGQTMARVAGSRDVALGLLTFAARNDRSKLRAVSLAATGVDAADAVTFAFASAIPGLRRGGIGGGLSGAAAAATGIWAWRRLR
ncbi:MAG: DUF4267 domain-containing protein [Solirubrobacterales bacterium]